MADLARAKRILRHYIIMALGNSGTRVDGDTHAELDIALDGLIEAIQDKKGDHDAHR